MEAGAASVAIDPPLPHDLQGYIRREQSARTHGHGDPLLITAVVLRTDSAACAILAADVVGYSPTMADRIRDAVAAAIGVTRGDVLINASHSHATPWLREDGTKLGGEFDEYTDVEQAYLDAMPEAFARAARIAAADARPARAAGGTGRVPGLAVNRRERTAAGGTILGWNRELTIDEEVPAIRIDDLTGAPIATIVAFGCHPVVVGPEVHLTGSDFIGPLRDRVSLLRGGGVCVFLQGAAGNVLPLEAFFDVDGPQVPFGQRLGLEAAHAVADSSPLQWTIDRFEWGSATPIARYRRRIVAEQPVQLLQVTHRVVDLPLLTAPSLTQLRAEQVERQAEYDALIAAGAPRSRTNILRYHLLWLAMMLAKGEALAQWRSSPGEVWAMRVGDCAIVGTPGEIFNEIGAAVRGGSPFDTTLFAGYSQGMLGYVATPEEHPFGGYEPAVSHRGYAHPAPFAPAAAGILVDTSLELLRSLAR